MLSCQSGERKQDAAAAGALLTMRAIPPRDGTACEDESQAEIMGKMIPAVVHGNEQRVVQQQQQPLTLGGQRQDRAGTSFLPAYHSTLCLASDDRATVILSQDRS